MTIFVSCVKLFCIEKNLLPGYQELCKKIDTQKNGTRKIDAQGITGAGIWIKKRRECPFKEVDSFQKVLKNLYSKKSYGNTQQSESCWVFRMNYFAYRKVQT